jgi:hypothetical protein
MVASQVEKVLTRGQRFERFDQLRQRHFWSNYFFAPGAGNDIAAGPYDIFRIQTGQGGQGYPAGITLTDRETNWRGNGRVPDNQNFVIQEIGVTIGRPPAVDTNTPKTGQPQDAPVNSIYAALDPAIQALIAGNRMIHPQDAQLILNGLVLEMGFLTNNVPIGLCADFSQSAGCYAQMRAADQAGFTPAALQDEENFMGDPTNGVPAAAFRRKLEVPILLQHGEAMGMRLNAHRPITTTDLANGGTGWFEVRVDWWASESFVEYS